MKGLEAGDDDVTKLFHARKLIAKVTGTLTLAKVRAERKQADEALRQSEAQLRPIADTAPVLIAHATVIIATNSRMRPTRAIRFAARAGDRPADYRSRGRSRLRKLSRTCGARSRWRGSRVRMSIPCDGSGYSTYGVLRRTKRANALALFCHLASTFRCVLLWS